MSRRKAQGIMIFVLAISAFFVYSYLLMLSEWGPIVSQLSILMIVAFFFSALSISEIFEDYVHDEKIKNISIKLLYSSAIIIPFLTIIVIFNLNI